MPAYMEPRRRSEPMNVGRTRPTSRVRVIEEQEDMTRGDKRLDRQWGSRHLLHMKDLDRQAEAGAREVARDGFIAVAEVKADCNVAIAEIRAEREQLTEMKHELRRAHEESQLMAGDDLELQTWFAQMDSAWYRSLRLRSMG